MAPRRSKTGSLSSSLPKTRSPSSSTASASPNNPVIAPRRIKTGSLSSSLPKTRPPAPSVSHNNPVIAPRRSKTGSLGSSLPKTRSPSSSLPSLSDSAGLFLGISIVPCCSLYHLTQHLPTLPSRLLVYYVLFINFLTWTLYYHDKRQARIGGWRTSESTLHLCELLGGWPAAFVSQRLHRHKTLKVGYQSVFCLIVLVHELLWLDSLMHGALSRWVFRRHWREVSILVLPVLVLYFGRSSLRRRGGMGDGDILGNMESIKYGTSGYEELLVETSR